MIDGRKLARPAARQFLEGTVVQFYEQFPNQFVELPQAEETTVTQARQNPAFNQEYAGLGLGFITRGATRAGTIAVW